MKKWQLPLLLTLAACGTSRQLSTQEDQRKYNRHEERQGWVAVEAEHFQSQTAAATRQWYVISNTGNPKITPDIDPAHYATASGQAYLEILPDTRTNHDEQLIAGENFSNQPGQLGLLHYPVFFNETGRYYVWVRAHSTGSEDNGIHVGLDGNWPESGRRMQWCEGKNEWTWASRQRTVEVHCGVPELIYLDIATVGWHTISFSMREDGFEFDKWLLSKVYQTPESTGPDTNLFFTRKAPKE